MRTKTIIELSRLTPEHLEDMREIRNAWVGRGILRNDRLVSPEEHRSWHDALDKKKDHVFLVNGIPDGRVLGYVACFSDGFAAGTAEIGVFFKEDCPWLLAPYHAVIPVIRHAFEDLGISRIIAYFRPENSKAIRFNASLGFEEAQRTDREVMTELTLARFRECQPQYRKFVKA